MTDIRAAAIALYDRYTHEGMDRRDLHGGADPDRGQRGGRLRCCSPSIAAEPAAAADRRRTSDRRIRTRRMSWPVGGGRTMKGYKAAPRSRRRSARLDARHPRESRPQRPYPRTSRGGSPSPAIGRSRPTFFPRRRHSGRRGPAAGDDRQARHGRRRWPTRWRPELLRNLPGANGKVGVGRLLLGRRDGQPAGRGRGRRVSSRGVLLRPGARSGARRRGSRRRCCSILAGLDERVNATGLPWAEALQSRRQDRWTCDRLSRRRPRLPQRHVGRALQSRRRRAGLGGDARLPDGARRRGRRIAKKKGPASPPGLPFLRSEALSRGCRGSWSRNMNMLTKSR